MQKIRVGVMGFGTIGQRLADAIALQGDMELVGVADIDVTLPVRALKEKGMPYRFFLASSEKKFKFENAGIPVSGSLDDLIDQVDVVVDASPTGMGPVYRKFYEKSNVKAIFQGAEKNDIAEVFFHSALNYHEAIGKRFLKMTSCYVTGILRVLAAINLKIALERVALTVIRRSADPGDYHRGLTNALQVSPAPCQMALDVGSLMPSLHATGVLIHAPITHSHVITMVLSPRRKVTREVVLSTLTGNPRIRVVSIDEGFAGNASLFKYARDLGNPRGDMPEIAVWKETITINDSDIMLTINVAQEGVVIPENMDAIRAITGIQTNPAEAMNLTNQYLGIGRHLKNFR